MLLRLQFWEYFFLDYLRTIRFVRQVVGEVGMVEAEAAQLSASRGGVGDLAVRDIALEGVHQARVGVGFGVADPRRRRV